LSDLILVAPMAGWAAPLEEVADAVFSERMLGDGIAIDPTEGVLRAPCDGTVIHVQETRHALTLRAQNGAEILMHIGLETVALKSAGFEAHVSDGQAVKAGEPLISFDLDFVARRARSLITPIIVTNGELFSIPTRVSGVLVAAGEPIMTLSANAAGPRAAEAAAAAADGRHNRSFAIPLAHGVHARPAAAIAAEAARHAAEVSVTAGGRTASARSPVALMALGIGHGDTISLSASGPDAEAVLAALESLILDHLAELEAAHAPPPPAPAPAARAEAAPGEIRGVTAAPGLAIGVAARLTQGEVAVKPRGIGVAEETAALAGALASVKGALESASRRGPGERGAILAAHLAFLDDPELITAAHGHIADGASAGGAWRRAVRAYVDLLNSLADPRMVERCADLIDLERQVLMALSGETEARVVLPEGAILMADDLLPSQLIALDASRLAGFVTARGGPTSHVAILAAAMNLPAVVAAGPGVLTVAEGAAVILDADAGSLSVAPDAIQLTAARAAVEAGQARRQAARRAAHEESRTTDGVKISVLANLAAEADALAAVEAGAEGCGLLRTEFLFLGRETAPSENEQLSAYQAIANALDGRPFVIRTLDVGGDKPVPYLSIPPEENPALGLRGVRVSLWRPDLLRTQLRAILRLQAPHRARVMVPMVASLSELSAVRALVHEIAGELSVAAPPVGVMVETPAAAMTADLICGEAEFISIGTNDLAQYALAMDRTNDALAAGIDGLHPAVLRLIGEAVSGARRLGRPAAVCGGLASDLAAAPILIGLGVTELSASPAVAAELKALIRTLSAADCARLARAAVGQTSAADVRALVKGAAR
jgi:phosphoenolpyruvate-protein phosphotransferase